MPIIRKVLHAGGYALTAIITAWQYAAGCAILLRRWVFATSTRPIEILNAFVLMGFGALMLTEFSEIITSRPYRYFTYVNNTYLWSGVTLVGALQLNALLRKTLRSNQASALIMQGSSLIYLMVAVAFGLDYPPLTPAFTTYTAMGIVVAIAGHEQMIVNKRREVFKKWG